MAARSMITMGKAAGTAALAGLVALAHPAAAADMSLRGSLPAYEDTGPNWSGIYGGVHGGIGSMTVTGLWSVFFPALRRADRLVAEDLIAAEKELSRAEPVG